MRNSNIFKVNRYAKDMYLDTPRLSYINLFEAYEKKSWENKCLRKKLKNSIPKAPKQHVNYKRLNKSIDDFKKLVDRS